jgi:hypothetical protein
MSMKTDINCLNIDELLIHPITIAGISAYYFIRDV